MPSFPLLRLPFLPLKSIIDNLSLGDLIRLQLCSKKLRQSLKAINESVSFDTILHYHWKNWNIIGIFDLLRLETYENPRGSSGCFPTDHVNITIRIGGDGISIKIDSDYRNANKYLSYFPFYIYVECSDHKIAGTKGIFGIDDITLPVVVNGKYDILHTFWEDQSHGLNTLVGYFKKFFNTQIINCFVDGRSGLNFSQNLRAAVQGMACKAILNFEIYSGIMNDDDYKFILDNVKPTIRFELLRDLVHRRDNNFQHNTKIESKCFKLIPAKWFTFDNLCSTDCEEIILLHSKLTNVDMHKYVKLWMDGAFPKLKRLTVELQEAVSLEYFQSYIEKCGYTAVTIEVINVINIKRQNQTVATIKRKGSGSKATIFELLISNTL